MMTLYFLARPARDRLTITPALYWSTRSRLDADAGLGYRRDEGRTEG